MQIPEPSPNEHANAMQWFTAHWRQIRYLYYLMFAFMAVPGVAEYFARIGPPQMHLGLRVLYTSIIGFLTVMVCYSSSYRTKEKALWPRVLVFGLLGLLLIVCYFGFIQRFSRYNSQEWERVIIGETYLPKIKEYLDDDKSSVPLSSEDMLKLHEWKNRAIWRESEIDDREFYCLLIWSLTIMMISASFSFFALQQDQRLINENKLTLSTATKAERAARKKSTRN